MNIYYRVSPFQSTHRPPVHSDNKYELIKLCYNSFLKAIDIEASIHIIADRIPPEWKELFSRFDTWTDVSSSNEGTFHTQVEMAKDKSKVLLLEDDYLWRPNTLHVLDRSLDVVPFISPYDHPGHYLEERFDKHYEQIMIDDFVVRQAPSNTLTFATTGEMLTKHYGTIMSRGTNDHEIFEVITLSGDKIYNPTYSLATHMVDGLLAPNVDWIGLFCGKIELSKSN